MAGGGAAALRPAIGLPRAIPAPRPRRRAADRAADAEGWLVVDLGARIGSLDWFRGLGTCGLLCLASAHFAPDTGPIAGQATAGYTAAQYDEATAQAIAPLALGGGTGRRMIATAAVAELTDTPERPSVALIATLGQGDGFARVLGRAGVGREEAEHIAALVATKVSLDAIKPGTVIDLTLGRRADRSVARPVDRLSFRARFDLALALGRIGGRLTLIPQPIAVDDTPLRIQGRVGDGLYLAARAAGAPGKAVESYIKALARQISIGSIGAGDRFDLIVAHRRAATGETETGDLLYAGLQQKRRDVRMLRWVRDGQTQWFDASGTGEQRGEFHAPVQSTRVTSSFGMRMHPLLGYSRMHRGVDFGAPYGAPIMAATDGSVAFAGRHGGHGNYVLLKHAGDMMTGYAHMSRILVQPGGKVVAGQVIGYVGSTGLSTGPHLHYEVYRGGVPVNPSSIRFASAVQLAGTELARFKSTLSALLAVRAGAAVRQARAESETKARRG